MPKEYMTDNTPDGGDNWTKDVTCDPVTWTDDVPAMDQIDSGGGMHGTTPEGGSVPAPEEAIEFDYEN
jgi:hypothetical protein